MSTDPHSRSLLVLLGDERKEVEHRLSSLRLGSDDVTVDREQVLLQGEQSPLQRRLSTLDVGALPLGRLGEVLGRDARLSA